MGSANAAECVDNVPKSARKVSPVMPVRNLADLKSGRTGGGSLMGLDLGDKTIGMALADTSNIVATPMDTIRRSKFKHDAAALKALIEEYEVTALIVGLPVNMDGSEGPRCQSVRQFADNLLHTIDIDIAFWDERLSTAAVTRTLIEADMSRAKRARVVDKMAAAYILQGALDFLANKARAGEA